jgi:hypothetical protein
MGMFINFYIGGRYMYRTQAAVVQGFIAEQKVLSDYGLVLVVEDNNFVVFKEVDGEDEFRLTYETLEEIEAFAEGFIRARGKEET